MKSKIFLIMVLFSTFWYSYAQQDDFPVKTYI